MERKHGLPETTLYQEFPDLLEAVSLLQAEANDEDQR
jgi:hypothetical protein